MVTPKFLNQTRAAEFLGGPSGRTLLEDGERAGWIRSVGEKPSRGTRPGIKLYSVGDLIALASRIEQEGYPAKTLVREQEQEKNTGETT